MSLLEEVEDLLDRERVPHALIGAAAMAVHGVNRATVDIDVFTVDTRVLRRSMWEALETEGTTLLLLTGEFDDPLAGNVRLSRASDRIVDVVVGRHPWQREIIDLAERLSVGEVEMPVARPAGLVLLKLFTGGPNDAWDVRSLLESRDPGEREILEAEVNRLVARLPQECRLLWRRIQGGG